MLRHKNKIDDGEPALMATGRLVLSERTRMYHVQPQAVFILAMQRGIMGDGVLNYKIKIKIVFCLWNLYLTSSLHIRFINFRLLFC